MPEPQVTAEELAALRTAAEKAKARPYFIAECGGVDTAGMPLLSLCYGDKHDPADTYDLIDGYDLHDYAYLRDAANLAPRLLAEVERLTAERDAYRKAKQENDERFMLERDAARAERDRFHADLDSAIDVMAAHDIPLPSFLGTCGRLVQAELEVQRLTADLAHAHSVMDQTGKVCFEQGQRSRDAEVATLRAALEQAKAALNDTSCRCSWGKHFYQCQNCKDIFAAFAAINAALEGSKP